MKYFFSLLIGISAVSQVNALVISEIMSNPTGDDSGREWIEVFNNKDSAVDLSSLTISIKGGNPVVVTPLSGGTMLAPGGYAVIGSVVSGATKFLQDYATYGGSLFKSSISLVNTGVTSIEIKLNGTTADTLASYTAAKEGYTLALIGGSFVQATPTPGNENQAASSGSSNTVTEATSTTSTQQALPAQSQPSPDIVIYMPFEKTVVAGADAPFSVYGQTRAGANIDDLVYLWAYGDGGQGSGTSTTYKYVYPGRYAARVEASNGHVFGMASTKVHVVAPDISITKVGTGKYGLFVDVFNPNAYDLDLSQWKLSIDGRAYPFPKNTFILGGETAHFSGVAMGFASTSLSSIYNVKILFPNLEDVTSFSVSQSVGIVAGTSTEIIPVKITAKVLPKVSKVATSTITKLSSTTTPSLAVNSTKAKDTRLVSWFKSLFGK